MRTTVRFTRASGRRSAALSLAAVLAAGCAGAEGTGGLSSLRRTPGRVSDGTFAPGRPAVASYGQDPSLQCQTGGVIGIVQFELQSAAKRTGRPAPEADGRLCAAAEAFLGWDAGKKPRDEVVAFVSNWFGLPQASRDALVAQIESDDPKLVADRILEPVGTFTVNADAPRYGMATSVTRRGTTRATKVAVVMLDAMVDLDALPRRLEPGTQAAIAGRVLGEVTAPQVSAIDPSGHLATAQGAGREFKGEVRCGDRPGEIRVEVRGERAGQSIPVASFPVACGTAPQASIAVEPEQWPAETAQQVRRIFEAVNGARAAAGQKPLVWDDALAQVASGVAESLKGGGAGADVLQRLKAAGISSPVTLQSLAADRSADRAYGRLTVSPSNRANMLNPEVTNVGVGIFSSIDPQNRPLVFLAEVFVKELPPADSEAIRAKLRDAVAQKRKDARTTPLASDPLLEKVADEYARALAAGGGAIAPDESKRITAPLDAPFKTVNVVSGAKQEPLDFAEEPQVVAAGKSLGVGVALGKNPVLGRNAVYVVVMVGAPREAGRPARAGKAKR